MNVHLYRESVVKDADLLAICPTVEDCDILHRYGWVATTILTDDNSVPVSWCARMTEEIVPHLENKRIVIFAAPFPLGRVEAGYLVSTLAGRAADIRIVFAPEGKSIYSYFVRARSIRKALEKLETLVKNAVPITSSQAFTSYECLKELQTEIENEKELWPLKNIASRFEAEFVQLQRKLARKRAKA